jgi:hypothetical protein
MTDKKNTPKTLASQRPVEQKGVVIDVVMPLVQAGVGGAVGGATGALVANAINKPKNDK